jgi:uncharacterized protein (TIGR03083 family)
VRHLQHCDALEAEVAVLAAALEGADVDRVVPTCPEWSVADLARHVGQVHRWAERLVAELAPARIPSPTGGQVTADTRWILDGAAALLDTLRRTDPELGMWAWGRDQHVRFWSRRQLHETLVHRVDLQLACGLEPSVAPTVAADAIDELLDNLAAAGSFSPRIAALRGTEGRLGLTDTTTGRRWTVDVDPFAPGSAGEGRPVDTELSAEGSDLLLVLYQRRPLDDIASSEGGDRALLRQWLDHLVLA